MTDPKRAALAATQSIRRSPGYASLAAHERAAIDRDLGRIEAAMSGRAVPRRHDGGSYSASDPFAVPLETPGDLRGGLGSSPSRSRSSAPAQSPSRAPARPATPRAPAGTEVLGERAQRALEAVDFPSFVAGLIQGTFQAIVDATTQQVREYARLVADLSKSLDEFTRDNVSDNQARDHLFEKYPRDLELHLPAPGEDSEPRLSPRRDADDSPQWLADHGLAGESLTPELAEGALLDAGRRSLGEDRMRSLATLVLMGINRIVVNDGTLRARLQFHARAREKTSAELIGQTGAQQMHIANRQSALQSAVTTMVSTVDVNTQADVSIKADLVGEISVSFRTETFDIQRFADSQAIELINRHSLSRQAPAHAEAPPPQPAGVGEDAS